MAEPRAEESTAPAPGTLAPLRPPLLNVLLFILTAESVFLSGSVLTDTQLPPPTDLEQLWHGATFMVALLAILLAHEMGHFVLARRHRVDATWPLFIPAPALSLIGTLGAVIRLRSLPRTRRALLDVGAAGPLAGALATLPVLLLGLQLSTRVPVEPAAPHWSLFEALWAAAHGLPWPSLRDAFDLGQPLAMTWLAHLVRPDVGEGFHLALHPLAVAGWFGLFLTALNLLPLGQLDGGHVLYAVSPRLHRALGPPLSALLFALGVFTSFTPWLFWGLLMGLGLGRHPELPEPAEPLPKGQRALALACLVLFAVCFTPTPVVLLGV